MDLNNYNPSGLQPQRVYNKKIAQNIFENVVGTPFNQLVPAFPVNQVTPISVPQFNIQPQAFNSAVPQFSIPNQGFNPNVWDVRPTHQIFIAPIVTPLNQAQNLYITPNNLQNSVLQNASISQPMSNTFSSVGLGSQLPDRTHNQTVNKNCSPKFGKKKRNLKKKIGKQSNKFKTGPIDLRQFLIKKRNLFVQNQADQEYEEYNKDADIEYYEAENVLPNSRQGLMDSPRSRQDLVDRPKSRQGLVERTKSRQGLIERPIISQGLDDQSDVDDSDWFEENMSVPGTELKLDVTNLKYLANAETNPDRWYIVADQNMLLNHLAFLNLLLESDDECHLMMPREVFSSLQAIAASGAESRRNVNRARRAIALFTQNLDAGMALIGEDPEESEDRYLINCCQNLADQNYYVVLISNDPTLKEYKDDTEILILTLNEVKDILSSSSKKDCDKKLKITALPIKITFANDFRQSTNAEITHKVDSCVKIDIQEKAPPQSNIKQIQTEKTEEKSKLKTSDACIQTDTVLDFDGLGLTTPSSSQDNDDINKNIQTDFICSSFLNTHFDYFVESEGSKSSSEKKHIQFNKPASQPNETKIIGEKPQYKWRRIKCKRNMTCNLTSKTDDNKAITNIRTEAKAGPNKDEGNMEGSEASSPHKCTNLDRNITFEETSTSGVISNTTSVETEVDIPHPSLISQSYLSTASKSAPSIHSPSRQGSVKSHSSVMFEVRDQNMENDLKTRSDEWVSRFGQIMEEVLTQVLQKDPPFRDNKMPAPWSVQEAVQCIMNKYLDQREVVEAAEDLAVVLDTISDKGRIKMDLSPPQFMKMYSYGVHLVQSLQVFQDCEDLQIASELLTRLLKDIENPNNDTSNIETFNENNQMPVASDSKAQGLCDIADTSKITFITLCDNTAEDIAAKMITKTNIEDKIFKSPQKLSKHSSPAQNCKSDFTSNSPYPGYRNFDSQSLLMSSRSPSVPEIRSSSSSPKIMRNLMICPEFEKKLKIANPNPSTFSVDFMDDVLDYEGYDDDEYKMKGIKYYGDNRDNDNQVGDKHFNAELVDKECDYNKEDPLKGFNCSNDKHVTDEVLDYEGCDKDEYHFKGIKYHGNHRDNDNQVGDKHFNAEVLDKECDYNKEDSLKGFNCSNDKHVTDEVLDYERCSDGEENHLKDIKYHGNNRHNDNQVGDKHTEVLDEECEDPLKGFNCTDHKHVTDEVLDHERCDEDESSLKGIKYCYNHDNDNQVVDKHVTVEALDYERCSDGEDNHLKDVDCGIKYNDQVDDEPKLPVPPVSVNMNIDFFLPVAGTALRDAFTFCKQSKQELGDRMISKFKLGTIYEKANECTSTVTNLSNKLRELNRESRIMANTRAPNRSVLSKCYDQACLILKHINQIVTKVETMLDS